MRIQNILHHSFAVHVLFCNKSSLHNLQPCLQYRFDDNKCVIYTVFCQAFFISQNAQKIFYIFRPKPETFSGTSILLFFCSDFEFVRGGQIQADIDWNILNACSFVIDFQFPLRSAKWKTSKNKWSISQCAMYTTIPVYCYVRNLTLTKNRWSSFPFTSRSST